MDTFTSIILIVVIAIVICWAITLTHDKDE